MSSTIPSASKPANRQTRRGPPCRRGAGRCARAHRRQRGVAAVPALGEVVHERVDLLAGGVEVGQSSTTTGRSPARGCAGPASRGGRSGAAPRGGRRGPSAARGCARCSRTRRTSPLAAIRSCSQVIRSAGSTRALAAVVVRVDAAGGQGVRRGRGRAPARAAGHAGRVAVGVAAHERRASAPGTPRCSAMRAISAAAVSAGGAAGAGGQLSRASGWSSRYCSVSKRGPGLGARSAARSGGSAAPGLSWLADRVRVLAEVPGRRRTGRCASMAATAGRARCVAAAQQAPPAPRRCSAQ